MKKVTNIHIQGVLFRIEEQAYEKLDKYLRSISRHFKTYPDSEEIIKDIEARIAEKFQTEVLTDKHTTITLDDVKTLIASMGEVRDLVDESDQQSSEDESQKARYSLGKRLYRETDERVVAGVAAGLAAYFGIDPVFVRLLFVIATLFWGWGVLAYLILWVVVPRAITTTQKLEMRGSTVTLSGIEKTVKAGIDRVPRDSSKAGSLVREAADSVARGAQGFAAVASPLAKLLLQIVGLTIVIGSALGIAGLTFTSVAVGLGLHVPYLASQSQELVQIMAGLPIAVIVGAAYLVALMPLLVILQFGSSLLRLKSAFSWAGSLAMFIVWLTALGVLTLVAIQYGPSVATQVETINRRVAQETAAAQVSRELPVSAFNSIATDGRVKVTVRQGDQPRVVATALPADLERFSAEVTSNELVLSDGALRQRQLCILFCRFEPVKVEITTPNLETLIARDLASYELIGTLESPALTIELHDLSRFEGSVEVENLAISTADLSRAVMTATASALSAELRDSSRLELTGNFETGELTARDLAQLHGRGSIETLSVTARDSAHFNLAELTARTVTASTRDISRVTVAVAERLTASAADASKILYRGNPTVDRTVSDVAKVEQE